MRRQHSYVATVVLACALLVSGCSFGGINQMVLPGGKGTGSGALHVTVDLPDVGTLTPNAQVKVGDIAVGTVTAIRAVDWHAQADLSLEPDVTLPANALARVGVNTLLGAAYVELDPPANPQGRLADGARIPLARGHAYPSTEEVLSAASVALNGGGLEQVSTITRELNKVLGGNDHAVADLLPRLNSFIGTLNGQRSQILGAIHDLNTLAARFDGSHRVINDALDQLGPAVETLSRDRPDLTKALGALSRLSGIATPLVDRVRGDLIADLKDIQPALVALNRAGPAVVRGLGFAVTFPFAPETVQNVCRGDYCNLDATFDLTNSTLFNGFTTPSGGIGVPGLPGLDIGAILNALTGGKAGSLLSPLLKGTSATSTTPGSSTTTAGSTPTSLTSLLSGLLGGKK
jgi:phospholipid/cholesterol/gamma-HCH transport system substrate-binding protein